MIKDFQSFINEALTLRRDGGAHYRERVETRLARLDVIGFTNKKGERVDATNLEIAQTQAFFREALSRIADHNDSKIFRDTAIEPGNIGIVRLGKPKVTLSSGEEVEPIFRVYERTDQATGQPVMRTGKCFWLFTIGSQVSTIKLYNVDGNSTAEKKFLIEKSIDHMLSERAAEIARISRVFGVSLESREDLERRHTVTLTPGGVSIVSLNFTLEEDPTKQLANFLADSIVVPEEPVARDPDRESTFSVESVPKQMNVTPGKVWLLEWNERNKAWGAIPIIQSKLTKGPIGNEIQVKLGKKWLHWLPSPVFNTPMNIDRILKKGETITLAKELGNTGEWLANTGTITDIGIDSRSSEYPYVKTDGWDKSIIIPAKDASVIFTDYRMANESYSPVLSFQQWTLANLR